MVASIVYDTTKANDDGDHLTIVREPEIVLGPAANGGMGVGPKKACVERISWGSVKTT